MDIRVYSEIQIQMDKGLTNKSSVRSSSRKAQVPPSPDQVHLANRAAGFAQYHSQVEQTKGLTGDLESIDTPANARRAAENITKYGP